jgi:hypothetical protein
LRRGLNVAAHFFFSLRFRAIFCPSFGEVFEEAIRRTKFSRSLSEDILHRPHQCRVPDIAEADLEPDDLVPKPDLGLDDAARHELSEVLLIEKDSGFWHYFLSMKAIP